MQRELKEILEKAERRRGGEVMPPYGVKRDFRRRKEGEEGGQKEIK